MKKFCLNAVIFLLCLAVFAGCGGAASTPDKALKNFVKEYKAGNQEKLSEYSTDGGKLVSEVDEFIQLLAYDEESSKKLLAVVRDVNIEPVGEGKEEGDTAILEIKLRYKNVAETVRQEVFSKIISYDKEFKPLSNNFEENNELDENMELYFKKDGENWKIDLSNEKNAPFINALFGNFIKASDELFHVKDFSSKNKMHLFPNNEIKFLDGNKSIKINVDPKLKDGNLIPFYNPMRDNNLYPGWDEKEKILYAVKRNDVISTPFTSMKLAGKEVLWPDYKKVSKNQYTRENIGVTDKSYCNIEIMSEKTAKGAFKKSLLYKENNLFMTVGLFVRAAGEDIEEPLVMYIDGHEVGKTRRGADDTPLDVLPEDLGNPSEFFSINDETAKNIQTIGRHLVEILQINGENKVVYYQAIPYEVKDY